jgi:ribosomal protein L11 methyltransferase
MSGTRIFLRTGKAEAEAIFKAFERVFEDDGLAITICEMDEEKSIFEVSVYANDEPEIVEAQMREAAAQICRNVELEREELPDVDWVSLSLEGLKPVRAGRMVVYGSHDRDQLLPADMPILIEASQAFGTGHHGTTWGCLTMIQQVLKREKPECALDLGTGSGVLAIAIAKLARIPVLATDVDPVAVRVAQENSEKNGVSAFVKTETASGFHHRAIHKSGPFGLIVANILAKPLMAMAVDMAIHLEAGGSLILSGILDSQRRQVIAAYVNAGFRHIRTLKSEGWVTIHMK